MKPLRIFLLICFALIVFALQCKCQQLVKDSTGIYYTKTYKGNSGQYILKPIDTTSRHFYYLKKHNAFKASRDAAKRVEKNTAFFNMGLYLYQANLSQKNFVHDTSGHHESLSLQLSVDYFFLKNVGIGIGVRGMRFKNSGPPQSNLYNYNNIDTDKLVYGSLAFPIYVKFRIPADNYISFHGSVAYMPTVVDFKKTRYYNNSAGSYEFIPNYQYITTYGEENTVTMYDLIAGLTIAAGDGVVKINFDMELAWSDLPYFYYSDPTINKSIPQRFSSVGGSIGLSIDLARSFKHRNYPPRNKSKIDYL